jgi:hypothetical protein
MARDTFTVPATSARIERVFSKSGRVTTWMQSRLNPSIICEIMQYKNYLSRIGKPITPQQRSGPLDRSSINNEIEDEVDDIFEMEDAENDEERIIVLEWEAEWRPKKGLWLYLRKQRTFKYSRASK